MTTLGYITEVPLTPMSLRARAEYGSACTTIGPIPRRVVLTTTDSNPWGGASGHTYTFTRHPNGITDIDVVIVRDGKNLRGRLLGLVVGTVGKGVLEKAFKYSVKAIEARNAQ
jgi:hypothetical protein